MTFDPSDIFTGIVALLGGGTTASVIAGAIAFFVGRAFGKKPPQARSDQRLQKLAYKAEVEGKPRRAKLLASIGNNDRAALADWVEREKLVHDTVPVLLADTADRVELLDVVGKSEGVDLVKLIDEAKAKAKLPVATAIVGALTLVLCLVMSNASMAQGPERFEPIVETPVIDAPHFVGRTSRPAQRQQDLFTELNYHGAARGGHYSACGSHVGFWQRGRWRRRAAAVGRFILRPFR